MPAGDARRSRFLTAAWAFVAVNVLGTIVGGLAALPASNGQRGNVHDVGGQAVYGNGTAVSPPLFITILLGLCVLAAARSARWPGRLGAGVVFLFAGFYVSAGELGELTTSTSPLAGAKWELVLAFGAFGIATAAVVLLAGLWAAVAAFAGRRRDSQRAGT